MTLLYLLAMFGAAYAIKEAELFSPARNLLMRHSPFFIRLLSCWWCVGFWAGVFIYLLAHTSAGAFETFNPFEWIVWGFAGSAVSALGSAVYEKLTWVEIPIDKE
jgi:hypothetical protein